jgi:hypothetical protein
LEFHVSFPVSVCGELPTLYTYFVILPLSASNVKLSLSEDPNVNAVIWPLGLYVAAVTGFCPVLAATVDIRPSPSVEYIIDF